MFGQWIGGRLRRIFVLFLMPLVLAACGAEPIWAPEVEVQRAAYSTGDSPSITLYTVIRKASGEGAHAGLMIDGNERIMFDPAGTWWHRSVPERNDVHYGITPRILDFYVDYHARSTYDVIEQKIFVSPEVAALAAREVKAYGAVPKAMCGSSVSSILRKLPGFEDVPQTFFPGKIRRALESKPGVTTRTFVDSDADDNTGVLMVQASAL